MMVVRAMNDPEYRYRPWSAERKSAASERAKKAWAEKTVPKKPTIAELLTDEERRLEKELADLRCAISVLKKYGHWK